jgi:hypothetical protein
MAACFLGVHLVALLFTLLYLRSGAYVIGVSANGRMRCDLGGLGRRCIRARNRDLARWRRHQV